jgi:hypothetical protein
VRGFGVHVQSVYLALWLVHLRVHTWSTCCLLLGLRMTRKMILLVVQNGPAARVCIGQRVHVLG